MTSPGHGVRTVPMSYLIDVLLTTPLSTRFGKSPAGAEEGMESICPYSFLHCCAEEGRIWLSGGILIITLQNEYRAFMIFFLPVTC